jgi:hypothetical protein
MNVDAGKRSRPVMRSSAALLRPVRPPRRFESRRHPSIRCAKEEAVPLTQTQLVNAIAERAEMTKAEAKRALDALDEVVLAEIGNAQKVRIGGLFSSPRG